MKAFSLIEILLVVVILGVLASCLVVSLKMDNAREINQLKLQSTILLIQEAAFTQNRAFYLAVSNGKLANFNDYSPEIRGNVDKLNLFFTFEDVEYEFGFAPGIYNVLELKYNGGELILDKFGHIK